MADSTAFYVLWVLCCLLYIIGGIRRRLRLNQLHEWATLHAPLTGAAAASSRLDGALRDAEDGFHLCAVCGFENLKRRIFCLLCGTTVGWHCPESETKPQPLAQKLTRRQRRARSRKGWQRLLDGDGEMHWARSQEAPAALVLLAYKLEFEVESIGPEVVLVKGPMPEPEPVPSPEESTRAEPTDEREQLPSPQQRLQLVSIQEVGAEMHRQLKSGRMRLLDAASADPTRLSIRFSDDARHEEKRDAEQRKAEKKSLVEDAKLPFPSKLVQFIARASAVQHPHETASSSHGCGAIQLRVHRDRLLDDSIQTLAGLPLNTLRAGFRIAFRGETGVDAGGVYREWLLLLNEAILAPETGIFTCVDSKDQVYYLNPHSCEMLGEHHLSHFLAAGRLIGRALLEGNTTGFHLALPLLKIILGQPVGLSDLEHFDPETHASLHWVLENEAVDSLGLNFTVVERPPSGPTRVVELVPCGNQIDLTDANKHEYVDRKLKYLLFESVHSQLFAFLRGVYEVVPAELLMLFDAEELDYILSGSDEIDVDDWEKNTKYTADLIDQPVRVWFWEILRDMSDERRRRLLQFSTGASRVPLAGFAALTSYDGRLCPFTLKGVAFQQEPHIRSHACFNRLDLPLYQSKHQLQAMLSAITADDTNVHGFTIV